ncbi:hypothetical protein AT292_20870 [Enterobacter cloacae]|nr:hypothetical protein AT292_20870 [Enterobacter cloacae]
MDRIFCPLNQLAQKLLRFLLKNLTNIFQHWRCQLIIHFGFSSQGNQTYAGIIRAGNGNGTGDELMTFGETATETRRWE